ncbi:ATP-binding cassette domain-containing protein [Acidobacteriota bacterium]
MSLNLGPGLTVLLGANGAGKTTLLRVIAGLYPLKPKQYVIRNGAHPDWTQRPWPLHDLGYLAQTSWLDPDATVEEAFKLHQALNLTGRSISWENSDPDLRAFAGRKIGSLSGGERRRVELAIMLSANPGLILLDEPTVGLDAPSRMRLREKIIEAAGEDRIIVLSTHITEDIDPERTSRLVIVNKGSILFDGTPQDAINRASGRVFVARTDMVTLKNAIPHGNIISRTFLGDHVIVRFIHSGKPPVPADSAEPTLEEAFILIRKDGATDEASPVPAGPGQRQDNASPVQAGSGQEEGSP